MKSKSPPLAVAWIAVGILLSAAGVLETGCFHGSKPALSGQDQAVLSAYEQIRQALAADDFLAAKNHARTLAGLPKPSGADARGSDIQTQAQLIIDAMALDRQREAFRTLSAELAPLVAGRPGYYILKSPVEPQAIWIQRDAAADNPYMGKVMHDSGALVH